MSVVSKKKKGHKMRQLTQWGSNRPQRLQIMHELLNQQQMLLRGKPGKKDQRATRMNLDEFGKEAC